MRAKSLIEPYAGDFNTNLRLFLLRSIVFLSTAFCGIRDFLHEIPKIIAPNSNRLSSLHGYSSSSPSKRYIYIYIYISYNISNIYIYIRRRERDNWFVATSSSCGESYIYLMLSIYLVSSMIIY